VECWKEGKGSRLSPSEEPIGGEWSRGRGVTVKVCIIVLKSIDKQKEAKEDENVSTILTSYPPSLSFLLEGPISKL